jgi:hypothetical protein
MPILSFVHCKRWVVTACALLAMAGCATDSGYGDIPVADRRTNLRGLEAVSIDYLNAHPGEFHIFGRILTAADEALGAHETLSHGAVMRWIQKSMQREGYDESMPVYRFLKTVYLAGWEGARWTRVSESEREYLYDLISAVMGGMHLCENCSTDHRTDAD